MDKNAFVANWVNLVKNMVADAPETNGKLLVDFINEPDGCVTWLRSFGPNFSSQSIVCTE